MSYTKSMLKARRKFTLKFLALYLVTIGLLLATCSISVKYLTVEDQSNFFRYFLILSPVIPALLLLFLSRWFLKSTDELHRNIVIKGLLWGLSATMLMIIPWSFLEFFRADMLDLRANYLLQIFVIFYAIGMIYGHWKSGAYVKSNDYDPWREPKS